MVFARLQRVPVICLAFLALIACSDTETPGDEAQDYFSAAERTLNIAHRGGVREAPEHTLLAYERALESGADVLELDVHLSRDGELIVLHDTTVDRTTDGEGPIAELSLEEIRALDAAYNFSPDRESFPERGQGHRIPTAREVFEAFPSAPYVIELKPPGEEIASALIDLIREFQLEDRTIVASVNGPTIRFVREAAPELLTSFSLDEGFYFIDHPLETFEHYSPPSRFFQLPLAAVDDTVLEKARMKGVHLQAFTVNDEDEMKRLIEAGINGIMTDRPSLLDSLLHSHSHSMP